MASPADLTTAVSAVTAGSVFWLYTMMAMFGAGALFFLYRAIKTGAVADDEAPKYRMLEDDNAIGK